MFSMKKTFAILFIYLFIGAFVFPDSKADVISKSGHTLILNKGSKDGVKVRMTGIVKTIMVESGREYDINVGYFTIRRTTENTSEAYIKEMAPGMNAGQAKYVLFKEILKPPVTNLPLSDNNASINRNTELSKQEQKANTTPTDSSTDSKTPSASPQEPKDEMSAANETNKHDIPTETIPAGKSLNWYLEKGDGYFDRGKYQTAKKFYQEMLKIDPQDPIALKKISECNQMIYLPKEEKNFLSYIKRADESMSLNKTSYALEYYLAAYKLLPSKVEMIAQKFKKLSETHKAEWEKFKQEHLSEIKPILDKYFIHPGMPEEVSKIKAKAKKVYKNPQGYWEAEFDYDIVMIYIPEGEFLMGNNKKRSERPVHKVLLNGYWIGKYELTRGQWQAVWSGKSSSSQGGSKYPVAQVSWYDAQRFIDKLNSKIGLFFRLPTEAEWEKAARGTDQRLYPWGNHEPSSCRLANYYSCREQTSLVGSHPSGVSPYGAYDMAGNVWEWCSDRYSSSYYKISPGNNPTGPAKGSKRILRGGGWCSKASYLSCSCRDYNDPSSRFVDLGFRLAMD